MNDAQEISKKASYLSIEMLSAIQDKCVELEADGVISVLGGGMS